MIALVATREDVARQMLPLAARHAASTGKPVRLHCYEGQALDLIQLS
jgi:hypothetical protein